MPCDDPPSRGIALLRVVGALSSSQLGDELLHPLAIRPSHVPHVEVRPTKVTHLGGPDWIINADAWTKRDVPGWEPATFYWEMVNGRTRFKLLWEGDIAQRLGK